MDKDKNFMLLQKILNKLEEFNAVFQNTHAEIHNNKSADAGGLARQPANIYSSS